MRLRRLEILFVLSCLTVLSMVSASLLLPHIYLISSSQTAKRMSSRNGVQSVLNLSHASSGLFERLKPRARLRSKTAPECLGLHVGRDWNANPVKLVVHDGPVTPRAVVGRFDPRNKNFAPCECACVEAVNATDADAIVLLRCGGNFLSAGMLPKCVKKVMWTMESEVNCPLSALTAENFAKYDVIGSPRLASDVPLVYASRYEYNFAQKPMEKRRDVMAVAFISNCNADNKRMEYMEELERANVSIHYYGRCRMTGDLKEEGSGANGKLSVIRHYQFTLAFENSNSEDYVTEKFFHALVAGSVPVHLGVDKENIALFAPENSYLNVRDYKSPAELATAMIKIANDDQIYNGMLQWKEKDLDTQPLGRLMQTTSDVSGKCRLCCEVRDILLREAEEPV
jgi:hypothetical protein